MVKSLSAIESLLYTIPADAFIFALSMFVMEFPVPSASIVLFVNVSVEEAVVFVSSCVWMALVTPFKYPNSVLVTVPSCIKLAFSLEDEDIVSSLEFTCVCKSPRVVVTFVAKLAELSNAAANSLNVSSAPGAEFTRLETAVDTNCVVAICVVLVPDEAVGARGVPVRVGDAMVA